MKPDHENSPFSPDNTESQATQGGTKLILRSIEERFGADAALAAIGYADLLISYHNRELAHQLRTTLTSLQGAAARLSAAHASGTYRSDVIQAQMAVSSLRGLARNVEAFSTPLDLEVRTHSIASLIKEAYVLAMEAALEKGNEESSIKLIFIEDEDANVRISRNHMLRSFASIVQSVVEFSDKGHVEVTVGVQSSVQLEKVSITVTNGSDFNINDAIEASPSDVSGSLQNDAIYRLLLAKRIIELLGGEMRIYQKAGKVIITKVDLPRVT